MTDNKAAQQMKMFKKEIPEMPEGYYSSGPNPNLEKFVQEHATPYNPATDNYNVSPFNKPIKSTKATAIYNMHTYWSKKPHGAIREYIRHFSKPEDLVMDTFCGSGGTAVASLIEGRKAIAIDLSPAATFITKNYCTPIDVQELSKVFNRLEHAIQPEIDWLYETRCDRCDGKARTNYVVWSTVYECPRCLKKISLFDCAEAQIPNNNGLGTKKATVCPYCLKDDHFEEISTRSTKRFDHIPVLVNYSCLDGCNPVRAERKYNDPIQKKSEYFQKFDIGKIYEIEGMEIPYWYPKFRMMYTPKDQKRWGDLWRAGYHRGIERVDQFFTKRNLWALSLILNEINKLDDKYKSALKFSLTSFLLNLSKLYKYRESGGGQPTGNFYVPQISRENEAWSFFTRKFKDIIAGKEELLNQLETTDLIVSTQSATELQNIEDSTIDYIFTDPPYGGNYQYGELNFIWEAWMDFSHDWYQNEVVINETRGHDEMHWANLLKKALGECYRVLKPGRWITLCYHDTSEGTWQLLQDLLSEIGFISEHVDRTLFIDTDQKTYNQSQGRKVTKRDLIINFRKPRPGETQSEISIIGDEDEKSFNQKASVILTEVLENSPGSSADRLFDELVSRMVRKGEFERHNFDKLLREVAEEVRTPDPRGSTISRWYLLETAGEVDAAESRKEEAVARRLEDFMAEFLTDHPEFEGVHYSDLFEQYLPVGDKPRRMLADWLPEFFNRTSEGTWRPPTDGDERQQKQHLRTNGTLRRIKRFTNAILNSVPPAERDRPENVATLTNWINECRKAGLYDQGKLLYEQGGLSFDTLSEKAQLEVKENYLICTRRTRNDDDKQISLL